MHILKYCIRRCWWKRDNRRKLDQFHTRVFILAFRCLGEHQLKCLISFFHFKWRRRSFPLSASNGYYHKIPIPRLFLNLGDLQNCIYCNTVLPKYCDRRSHHHLFTWQDELRELCCMMDLEAKLQFVSLSCAFNTCLQERWHIASFKSLGSSFFPPL